MKPQKISSDRVWDINYPIYVSPVLEAQDIIHIPGQFEYKYLDEIYSYVVEAYKTKDKIYIYDAIPINLWNKRVCKIPYEKRLKTVRELVFSQVAKVDKVLDLDVVLIDNPAELFEYCDNLLTQDYKKIRIMDVNGDYVFGDANNGECLELLL